MTPEERERRRRIWLARTGPLSSGIAPPGTDRYSYQQMPISDEAWYTLPPGETGGHIPPEEYRSAVDRMGAMLDENVLSYLTSKELPSATTPTVQPSVTRAIDPSVIPTPTTAPTPEVPVIPSGGGLSAAAQNRINELQNKWGGWMDAHAFATGAKSLRGSFDASLKSAFGTAKDDKFQTIEHGNFKYTMHRNPQTGEWTVIAAAPRWEPKQWSTHKDINGRARFSEGPHMGKLVSEVAGQPMVEKEYQPRMVQHGDRQYWAEGPKAGQPVIAGDVELKPEFTELADGRKYWVTGPKAGQLVLDKDLKKAPDPTEDIKEHEYAENLLRAAAIARKDEGVNSEAYKNAISEYNRFVSRSTTAQSRTEDIQEYEYLNSLTTIADNMKDVYGENSSQYISAKADADRFATQIATGTTQGYKPEVRLFHRLTPAEGEQDKVAGYIDYTGDKPVFKDMNGEVLTNVVPIPKTEITTTQQDFIQTLTPVKTAIGEGVVDQIDTAIDVQQFKDLLVDLETLGKGTTGFRGVIAEKIGGPLGQISPALERGFVEAIGGVTAEDASAYRNRLRHAVMGLIELYTAEESGRITEAEREITREATRMLSPDASEIQIRSALRNVLELKLIVQMKAWISGGFDPRYDLTTKEGVKEIGEILFEAGFKDDAILKSLTRLKNIQIEMQKTHLGRQ